MGDSSEGIDFSSEESTYKILEKAIKRLYKINMKIIKLKTLNEAVEEITDKTYSVIDHNLASAKK